MEKFVNEVTEKLSHELGDQDLGVVRKILYMVIDNYEIHPRETGIAVLKDPVPQELKEYIVTKRIEGKSKGTLKQYYFSIKRFILWIGKPIPDVKTNDIRIFLYRLSDTTKMSEISLENQRIMICSFFKWLSLNGYIDTNPAALIQPIKHTRKIREPLSDTEMECLRLACENYLEKSLIEVFYSTGCRLSELLGIKIKDINFDTREVKLFGKGKKERIGYLNAKAILYMRMLLETRKFESEYLFASSRCPHGQISRKWIEKTVRDLGVKAGIPGKVFPHRIRHTTATDALRRGMPVEQVQALLGHENIKTTLVYAKVNTAEIKEKHSKCIV